MTVPFRPSLPQTPTFADARRHAKTVMNHLRETKLLVWVMRAGDSVRLVRFNKNGSWSFQAHT